MICSLHWMMAPHFLLAVWMVLASAGAEDCTVVRNSVNECFISTDLGLDKKNSSDIKTFCRGVRGAVQCLQDAIDQCPSLMSELGPVKQSFQHVMEDKCPGPCGVYADYEMLLTTATGRWGFYYEDFCRHYRTWKQELEVAHKDCQEVEPNYPLRCEDPQYDVVGCPDSVYVFYEQLLFCEVPLLSDGPEPCRRVQSCKQQKWEECQRIAPHWLTPNVTREMEKENSELRRCQIINWLSPDPVPGFNYTLSYV